MLNNLQRKSLHPATIKALKQGHPWVTLDTFSKNFPQNDSFLIGTTADKKHDVAILLNDPLHPQIKARLWSLIPLREKDFWKEFRRRLVVGLSKRTTNLRLERDNFYLIFAEADFLPGLFIQKLGPVILVHVYCGFWSKHEKEWISIFQEEYQGTETIWIQERNKEQKVSVRCLDQNGKKNFNIQEYSINYKIELNERYDYGIYTDMASIRKKISSHFNEKSKVLNLYAYTGAFSLFALHKGVQEVVSVDLSEKYLSWLNENIKLNPQLKMTAHRSIQGPVKEILKKFSEKKEQFNFIICDPPSASSDGKKTENVLKTYEDIFSYLYLLTQPQGKILVFINTHQFSFSKWRQKILQLIVPYKNDISIISEFHLDEDCPRLKNFPEGDYLKGILLQKNTSTL